MRKISFLWLFIAAMLVITHLGIAQDQNRDPDELQRRIEQRERAGRERLNGFVMQRLDSLMERVGENIGQR